MNGETSKTDIAFNFGFDTYAGFYKAFKREFGCSPSKFTKSYIGNKPYKINILQEEHYADGMLYFLKHVDCNAVFPMHYWNEPSVIDRFITEYPQYKSRIKNTESAKGEKI